ncbi:TetR/AcrR family transcriptional regulator [Hansschlegelia zhihuaiae]|uniref:TetR/AcrR family transcriptional regulator n=1 Tax=Hansschlegelia zhihuaiae TaxID=405005 RepID=A0A4Q0MCV3_9HYPH|nr:TetR/AcrR family transcriptional regulator [Hansschlegelia zhihuaiae]RXF70923.1 TetR/AcrR family transcriptional regulator [Hansschlegelia zhihuaiae]
MGRHPPASTVTPSARQRILDAAMRLFSASSFDDTSLRDIAAEAQVDVAYVHRCYGSKEKLFAHALNVSLQPGRVFDDVGSDIGKALAREVFSRDAGNPQDVRALDIAVRSLSSAAARNVLKDVIGADLIAPLSDRIPPPNEMRAVLTIAAMAGIGLFRNVLAFEALQEPAGGELEAVVANLLTDIMRRPRRRLGDEGLTNHDYDE